MPIISEKTIVENGTVYLLMFNFECSHLDMDLTIFIQEKVKLVCIFPLVSTD